MKLGDRAIAEAKAKEIDVRRRHRREGVRCLTATAAQPSNTGFVEDP
jgi:hypothetical protein